MNRPGPIVVIGGGPAGAACARELANAGCAVKLLSFGDGGGPRFGEAGGPSLVRLLWNHGLTPPLSCTTPLTRFDVCWEDDALTDKATPSWDVATGVVLDRPAFDRWLRGEAERAGATIEDSAIVTGAARSDNGWRVFVSRAEGASYIDTPHVIEAVGRGRRSICRPCIKRHYTDRLIGISADLPVSATSEAGALLEAANDGWWFSLQVNATTRHVCYFTDADDLPESAERLGWWENQLSKTCHIRHRVLSIPDNTRICIWDARSSILSLLWQDRWSVTGDAAWTVDPLSGSGVERAIESGIDAARAVRAAWEHNGNDPLRKHAMSQVDTFRKTIRIQRRIYSGMFRFASRFWDRRKE